MPLNSYLVILFFLSIGYGAILVEDMKNASDNFFFKYSYKYECADLEFMCLSSRVSGKSIF
ncbi:hypothetical protein BpHYR1_039769 [Brachionus plicatilis]|uniref:Uncharacterized protein n=1 Tax=Brachionus plicatilis TaxID=10195 RepID=A0A3M7SKJ1_BRAPC|nr:hypothetical protein BpHYR1_039769 [Brachionus plicatilis]